MNAIAITYCVMERFAGLLEKEYDFELQRSRIKEWIEEIGGVFVIQGSFVTSGLKNAMVLGSDLDGICFIDARFSVMRNLLQAFCDKQTWMDEFGGVHRWTVVFKRNLARIAMRWHDAGNNDMGSNLKMDILLVKQQSVVKHVPHWNGYTQTLQVVHEALQGADANGATIELNVENVEKVKLMMIAISNKRLAWLAFLFMKTLIKAHGIEMPSVALMCCVIAGHRQATLETKADSDTKCWFSNIFVNTLNYMLAFSHVSNASVTSGNGDWTPFAQTMAEYSNKLQSCEYDPVEGPFFEVISPFQASLVQNNIEAVGNLMRELQFCRFDVTWFCNEKSLQTTINIDIMSLIVHMALHNVSTFDVSIIPEIFKSKGESLSFEPSVCNVFKVINQTNAEKDRLHSVGKTFESILRGEEIKKLLRNLLANKFGNVEPLHQIVSNKPPQQWLLHEDKVAASTLNVDACEFTP